MMFYELEKACKEADWQQVIQNGGPPCFHLEYGEFCFRAEGWEGHGVLHPYVSLWKFVKGLEEKPAEGKSSTT
jgi:hypothetical protein